MTEPSEATSTSTSTAASGTSRVELALSALVTAMVVLAVLWVATHQAGLRRSDDELNLAYVACQNRLEALRRLPIDQLRSADGSGFDVPGTDGAPGALPPLKGDRDGLPGEFAVEVDGRDGDAVLYRVIARVAWRGALRAQVFELETLMGERR